MANVRQAPTHTAKIATKRRRSAAREAVKQKLIDKARRQLEIDFRDCPEVLFEGPRRVHFPSKLEQGPTTTKFADRAASPARSAIRDPASAQLLDEKAASQELLSSDSSPEAIPDRKDSPELDGPHRDHYGNILGHSPYFDSMHEDDSHMCRMMDHFRQMITSFAAEIPNVKKSKRSVPDDIRRFPPEAVRYIGCLTIGSEQGEQGWSDLLQDQTCRQALLCGMIGRALQELVFGALWFGGSKDHLAALSKHEQESIHQDGFQRTLHRAAICRHYHSLYRSHGKAEEDGPDLRRAYAKTLCQIEQLLIPLWFLGQDSPPSHIDHSARKKLLEIVKRAAFISRSMRLSAEAAYQWPPTFKDEEFEPERMECSNLSEMIRDSPYEKTALYGGASLVPGSERRRQAIVRIVGLPGLVSYRKGGGSLEAYILRQELEMKGAPPAEIEACQRLDSSRSEFLTGSEGYRTRVICKATVHLQWGKQRLLTMEAGTSAHLDAKRDHNEAKYSKDYQGIKELDEVLFERRSAEARSGRRASPGKH